MSAILFGSISTVADTSELQRRAFNEAFAQHSLDWRWDQDEYVDMLESSGGSDRVAEYAAARGQEVDAAAIHQTKSELFQQMLASGTIVPRPGVVDLVEAARREGVKLGLVTTTSPENVSALVKAMGKSVDIDGFDVVVDSSTVGQPKPDPAAYTFAIEHLGERAEDCVAIEDNVGGVQSAVSAGISCMAFPNENTEGHEFADAAGRIDTLSFAELHDLTITAGA